MNCLSLQLPEFVHLNIPLRFAFDSELKPLRGHQDHYIAIGSIELDAVKLKLSILGHLLLFFSDLEL